MSEELSREKKEGLARTIAGKLVIGNSKRDIILRLVGEGWPLQSAVVFVYKVQEGIDRYMESPEVQQALAGKYARRMLYGVLMTIGGIAITGLAYVAPARIPASGTYASTCGAILLGIVSFFRGLLGWRKYRQQALAGKYARCMLYGVLITIGGIVITGLTYVIPASGTYVFTCGAILFGIVNFFRGLLGWRKYRM